MKGHEGFPNVTEKSDNWEVKMSRKVILIMFLFETMWIMGCATVPPASVQASRQIEKNLATMKQNNILLLDEWYNLSLDYWTEIVAREGPDKILEKAKKDGMTIDLTKDCDDLVDQILREYRNKFLTKLNESYLAYRDSITEDYSITSNAAETLTNLLQSIITVNEEQMALLESIKSEVKVKDIPESVVKK